jgi:hypothetical protein
MNEEQIAEVWTLFKEYIDKKQIEIVAEKFIDLIVDQGADDETIKACLGHDSVLDSAIDYYLDLDNDPYDDDEWD